MSFTKKELSGVVAVIPIPFTANEEIDEEALRRLVRFAVEIKLSGICLPAYGSEFYKLSEDERLRVVQIAVEEASDRTLVVAQSNHGSAKVAASLARQNVDLGANLISCAIPRQFIVSDDSLLGYLATVFSGVKVPCLLQDFNPGGPAIGVDFIVRLRNRCPDFKYVKLEEALMASKVLTIREALHDEVLILEGWGGLYLMELVEAGICGLMPGLGLADLLNRVFELRKTGHAAQSFRLFGKVLPHIAFSLQNMELFLYCEKRLLQARGLLTNAICRSPAYNVSTHEARYVDELNTQVLEALKEIP